METTFTSLQKYLKHKNKYTAAQIRDVVKKHFIGNTVDKISFAGIGDRYAKADAAEKTTLEKFVSDINAEYKPADQMDKLKTIMENPMMFVQNNFGLIAIITKQLSTPEFKQMGMDMVQKYDLLNQTTVDRDKILATVREFIASDDFPILFDQMYKLFLVMQNNLKL